MTVDIYTSAGAIRATVTPNEQSMHHKELMVSDYISLNFNAPNIDFSSGDYIIVDGLKYVLIDVDKPTNDNSQFLQYNLRFDAYWALLGKRVIFYDRQKGYEAKWSLTARATDFLTIIVSNANNAGIGEFTYSADSTLTDMKFLEFDGASILDALTLVAEAYECDWWIEGNIIHLGTCNIGTSVELKVGEALASVDRTSSSIEQITRLYAFGSTRNLPKNYRQDSEVKDGVVERRLKLPKGVNYIDARSDMKSSEIIEGIKIFEGIYPRTNGRIDIISTKEYTTEIENEDGGTTIETWNAYRFVDNSIRFSRDYQLDGQDLKIQFQSGLLSGMTFIVSFNPDNNPEDSTSGQEFEIIRNDDYGVNLPNDTIRPMVGDAYILTGWDSTKIADLGLVSEAENELLTEATKWLNKNGNGAYNYDCATNAIWCSGYRIVSGEYVYNAANVIDLEIGQSVVVRDDVVVGASGFASRVRAYEKNLINRYVCRYTIGESSNYSITGNLQEQVDAINRIADPTTSSNQGANIRLIRRYDSTPESDSLAYSSLRTKSQYLDKTKEDTAAKRITFESGIEVKGDGVVTNTITADSGTIDNITSSDYNAEFSGFTLKNTDDGSYLEVDKLNVRKKAVFRELGIKKIDHIGGANVTSPASCKIDAVDLNFPAVDLIDANGKKFYAADGEFLVLSDIADGYKCYFNATDGDKVIHNEWKVGDQALCHAFNLTTPRYYWRLVTAVSVEPIDGFHCVVLSMSDCDTDSDVPMAEDTIVCFGNRTDKDRQSVIIMDSEGVSAPYLRQLKGINSYNISDANIVTQLSPTKNIIRGETIELSTSSGNKGVQDLANDALKNAKKYTDTAFGDAKKYTDTSLGSAKEYADGVLGSAKEYADGIKELANSYTDSALGDAKSYADGVGTSALNAAKTYADGVGATAETNAKNYADGVANTAETNAKGYADGVGSTVKGYADGLFADAENYTQEREAYLQSQITANANGIGLCATKTELQSVSDGVNVLATRVTSAEASIKVNADGITALADKTEVDITALGNRISSAEASIQVNAGNIALKANQTDLETVKNSVNGLTTRMTSAETKITQNANAIKLKASKDDLTAVSNAVGGLETRMTAAESSLTVQADRISSVVSEYEGLVKQYGYSDFTIKCGWLAGTWITNAQGNNIGSPLGYEKDTACQLMILTDVEKGDAIRVVPKAKTQQAVVQIYGCDGDAQGAEQDAFNLIGEDVANYTWYGRSTTLFHHYDIDVDGSVEYAVPVDCREVHIWLSDDWSDRTNIQVFHIKAKISAQSRIDQTADNIRLQVGEAGINLDSKVITLDASKTIVTGDLAVSVVKTYWDAAQTQLKSAYNGNGEGTIVYYYPNGRVMKEDKFVSDTSGNIIGMRTTYYKANGEVAWVIDEGGFLTTLPDYWEVLNNGNTMCYSTDESAMMEILTQYLGEAMKYFSAAKFSRFVSQSGNYKNYNGKVSKAVRSSENPTTSMLWAGVLIYSVELYKDGLRPTYIVTYEVCTTALGQVGAITTKKFNSLGEIS